MARKSRSSGGKSDAAGSGSKPKRVRRKCSAPGCVNRVVQGGVCVTHGAKRKLCSFPNCSKAVKLAGFCSTHGPARRKCDAVGCTRVAVQGGKCLSHGARRRVCSYPLSVNGKGGSQEKCTKNAIMGGMCKKHYDRIQEANGMLQMSLCVPIPSASSSASGSVGSGIDDISLEGEQSTMESVPSWSSTAATTASTKVVVGGNVIKAPVAPSPITKKSSGHRRAPKKAFHQRGLSIFDEMPTVDAIINSGAGNQPDQESQPKPQEATSYPGAGAGSKGCEAEAPPVATKTPNTQVSFADCTSLPNSRVVKTDESGKTCMGNSSCTCDACRSPTLAIFEQMIQASQKIEKGDFDSAKYAGLSPPKLSPRKTPKESSCFARDTSTPKNVSFLPPEEPMSTGSVVRKVSSNNIVGEGYGGEQEATDYGKEATNYGGVPRKHQYHHSTSQTRQDEGAEGPASHALAAMARDDSVSRTVSHDVDESHRYHHHHPSYYPPHYYSQGGHPHTSQYPYPQAPPPYYDHRYAHHHAPPPGYNTHHPPQYHHHAGGSAPLTPTLYDKTRAPMAVVSSHSTHHHEHLLPKPRENMSHLFIPKEV